MSGPPTYAGGIPDELDHLTRHLAYASVICYLADNLIEGDTEAARYNWLMSCIRTKYEDLRLFTFPPLRRAICASMGRQRTAQAMCHATDIIRHKTFGICHDI